MRHESILVPLVFLGACSVVGSQEGYEPVQPIAFSHALHAGEYQISCTYCHYGAERGRHAGVPAASICMNCHTQVKKDSPEVQKVAQAVSSGTPLRWVKVHRLPDFAYFNHASHVTTGGLKCQTCHGPVETMVRLKQEGPMSMGWCLDCHRETVGGDPPEDCAACHF